MIYLQNGKILIRDGKIAIDKNCCCLEQWKDCVTNIDNAILDTAQTTQAYAWLCIGGVWKRSYYDRGATGIATNPSVLEQCGTTPASCSDLVGWPASDYFNGVGCNSGVTHDTNWKVRWTDVSTGGSDAIVSDALLVTMGFTGSNTYEIRNSMSTSGDFQCGVRIEMKNFASDNSIRQEGQLKIKLGTSGSTSMTIRKDGADTNSTWKIEANGTSVVTNWANDYVYFRITREAGAFTFEYSYTPSSWTDASVSLTDSSVAQPSLRAYSQWTADALQVEFDSFEFEGGFPVSDNYGGSGYNSGAVSDDNWNTRYSETLNNGTLAINSNALDMAVQGNLFNTRVTITLAEPLSGDFILKVTMSNISFQSNVSQARLLAIIDGSQCRVGREVFFGTERRFATMGWSPPTVTASDSSTSGIAEISRVSGTVSLKYGGVTMKTGARGGTLSKIQLWLFIDGNSSHTSSVTMDDLSLTQNGNNVNLTFSTLHYDPTGDTCT